ncbi:TetR/AcrR family transcriptional regulator [Achromobacter denitrificans]
MNATTRKTGETATAKRRKEQVLTAAIDCFRREGFHRTSMAQISAAAGMSSGHIYHYFGSKEKIVEAIVARERSELDRMLDELKAAMQGTDTVSAMVDLIMRDLAHYVDGKEAGLMLEVLAEAARNTAIAELIQRNDQEVRGAFEGLLVGKMTRVDSRGEILAALMDGLSIRALRNPRVAETLDMDMLRQVISHVLQV